ncbi:hypothetical protein HT576_21250 [Haloterrigena sp. SYSU A121-1]|uniref:Uncharacterized protein n=1 Tax=Haloterrigena gelatinilytica TaxID=2741724 RepID=A0A8J8GQW0_9EURY|nr:hypothetical protein [Haloterrigena gelatinilytica]NUB93525.1 hypothetical protein [Haloterrigena gelatinilytica]
MEVSSETTDPRPLVSKTEIKGLARELGSIRRAARITAQSIPTHLRKPLLEKNP